MQNYWSNQLEMIFNETIGTRKFWQWCYDRPTWPNREGPIWLKSSYSTRLAYLFMTSCLSKLRNQCFTHYVTC